MWHRVSCVAEVRGFNEEDFIKFALDNRGKYHVCLDYQIPEVNTWNVDQMIKDYKAYKSKDKDKVN